MDDGKEENLEFLIRLFLSFSIELPLYVCGSVFIYKNRDVPYIKKRKPLLIFLSITALYLTQLAQLIEFGLYYGNVTKADDIIFILDINDWGLRFSIAFTLLLRVWLLYYDLKLSIDLNSLKWIKQINDDKQPFFVKYKHNLGSFNWLLKWCLFMIVIITILANILYFCDLVIIFMSIATVITFAVFVVLIVLSYKMPKINDAFNIKREMKYVALVYALLIVTLVAGSIITGNFGENRAYINMIRVVITQIFIYALYYIQTIKSIRECWKIIKLINSEESIKYASASKARISFDKSIPTSWSKYICQSRNNFEKFMNHLVQELCCESMLFILEIMQWKQYILDGIKGTIKPKNDFTINTPSYIPQSNILTETDNAVQQCCLFVSKYLDQTSGLQINISHSNYENIMDTINEFRSKYRNIKPNDLNSTELNKLITIFDPALKEVSKLLQHIYSRYKQTLNCTDDTAIVMQLMQTVRK